MYLHVSVGVFLGRGEVSVGIFLILIYDVAVRVHHGRIAADGVSLEAIVIEFLVRRQRESLRSSYTKLGSQQNSTHPPVDTRTIGLVQTALTDEFCFPLEFIAAIALLLDFRV